MLGCWCLVCVVFNICSAPDIAFVFGGCWWDAQVVAVARLHDYPYKVLPTGEAFSLVGVTYSLNQRATANVEVLAAKLRVSRQGLLQVTKDATLGLRHIKGNMLGVATYCAQLALLPLESLGV